MIDKNKMKELFSDEAILKEFLGQKDIESARKFLEDLGIEVSEEELKVVGKVINEYAEKGDAMSEEDLEKIVGGALTQQEARHKEAKHDKKAAIDICTAIGLGIVSGISAGIATSPDVKGEGRNVAIAAAMASGALAAKNAVTGLKHINSSCWWKYIANNTDD